MLRFATVRLVFIILLLSIGVADYLIGVPFWLYIIPIILLLGFIIAGSSIPSLQIFLPAYTHPQVTKKQIAITFDDGPAPPTLEVLDVLKKFEAKATFFCIGRRIDKYPAIFERIVEEGHTVGNHSYSHSNRFPFFSPKKITEEINTTNVLISKTTGQPSCLFRPPFGVTNPAISRAVKDTRQVVIGWNLRSMDTTTKRYEKVVARIKARLRPGTVLLLHDDRENTAKILEDILHYTQSEGYECVDVKSIFKLKELC